MPIDVGTARVLITGDYSKLAADFTAAQGIASAGARQIGTSVSSAFAGATGLVDQFGRSVQTSTQSIAAATPAVLDLEGGITRLAFAHAILAQEMKNVSGAASHELTELQAISGSIRVGLGEQSIRAAERFIGLLPGVGAALKLAFPVIGAVALGTAIYNVASEATHLKESIGELQQATQKADAEFEKSARSIQRVNVELLQMKFGAAAGKGLSAFYSDLNASEDLDKIETLKLKIREIASLEGSVANHPMLLVPFFGSQAAEATVNKIRALGQEIEGLQADYAAKQSETSLLLTEQAKQRESEAGQLAAARIQAQISAAGHEGELARQVAQIQIDRSHAVQQSRINAMHDTEQAAVESAAEEVRVAQLKESQLTEITNRETLKRIALIRSEGAAESAGKSDPEKAQIAVRTAGQVADAQAEAAQKTLSYRAEVNAAQARLDEAEGTHARKVAAEMARAWEESFDAIIHAGKATEDAFVKSVQAELEVVGRVAGIQARGAGEAKQLEIEGEKLKLERQYGTELGHTLNQQVAYLQGVADLEAKARAAKLAGLQNELAIAEAIDEEGKRKEKVAELQVQINDLELSGANATYAAQSKILELERQRSLAGRVANIGARIPDQLGGALANGVGGGNIGREISQSLKNVGHDILGTVFSTAIRELAIKLGLQAALTGTLTAIMGTHTAVTAANTGVVAAHTGATLANTLSTLWNTISIDAQTLATWALATVEAVKTFFGFADGGRPPVGVPSYVGERGKELFVPDQAGTIIPNHLVDSFLAQNAGVGGLPAGAFSLGDGTNGSSVIPNTPPAGSRNIPARNNSQSNSLSFGDVHLHGVQNTRKLMQEISELAKNASPKHSPWNS